VHPLRHFEEPRGAGDDQPLGVDSERPVERDEGVQELRDPAAVGSRVDVGDAEPLQRLRSLPQRLEGGVADDRRVALERVWCDVDALEQFSSP